MRQPVTSRRNASSQSRATLLHLDQRSAICWTGDYCRVCPFAAAAQGVVDVKIVAASRDERQPSRYGRARPVLHLARGEERPLRDPGAARAGRRLGGALARPSLGRPWREVLRLVRDWLPMMILLSANDFTRGPTASGSAFMSTR